jgi:hypothetical protein
VLYWTAILTLFHALICALIHLSLHLSIYLLANTIHLTIPLNIPLLQEPYCSHPLPDGRSMRLTLTIYPAQDHLTGTSCSALTVLAVKCQPCGFSFVSRDCTAMCCTFSSILVCKHLYSALSLSLYLNCCFEVSCTVITCSLHHYSGI